MTSLLPAAGLVARFVADLDRLVASEQRIGVAVSGGPDSAALLLLAAAARPGQIEAASVDHALRSESRAEAEMVAALCAKLAVPHAILTAEWTKPPETALQERARGERYRLLVNWARERGLTVLLTGHHADDQVETLLMRLNRGSGLRGLAGIRPARLIEADVSLVRPLLSWRRSELERICGDAGIEPVSDPSNADERFERARLRNAITAADWLDIEAIARSASNLAEADRALNWAADREWREKVTEQEGAIRYRPTGTPAEIVRRVAARAIGKLASEGGGELRGREFDRLLETLSSGGTATLRGVLCCGGEEWRFCAAPKRRG